MKIHPVGVQLLHVDRQMDEWTDMTKLTVDFCNAYVPKKRGRYL
jgi:hypothetical protein